MPFDKDSRLSFALVSVSSSSKAIVPVLVATTLIFASILVPKAFKVPVSVKLRFAPEASEILPKTVLPEPILMVEPEARLYTVFAVPKVLAPAA